MAWQLQVTNVCQLTPEVHGLYTFLKDHQSAKKKVHTFCRTVAGGEPNVSEFDPDLAHARPPRQPPWAAPRPTPPRVLRPLPARPRQCLGWIGSCPNSCVGSWGTPFWLDLKGSQKEDHQNYHHFGVCFFFWGGRLFGWFERSPRTRHAHFGIKLALII